MRTPVYLAFSASLLAASLPVSALAQEYLATLSRQNQAPTAADTRAHVVVPKRADNLVRTAVLRNDTRDPARRRAEVEETLGAIFAAAASDPDIELSYVRRSGDDVFAVPLDDLDVFISLIANGSRPDSSEVRFFLKTAVKAGDDLESVEARLESFREAAEMTGRSELAFEGSPQLTLVDPRQYRVDVVAAIAAEAQAITAAMGEGYAVRITGVGRELSWRRSGDLELSLFIDHAITVVPRS